MRVSDEEQVALGLDPEIEYAPEAEPEVPREQFSLFGTDMFGEQVRPAAQGVLAQRFEMPPFSVLNAQAGDWRERKRRWLALGIRSEEGRNAPAYAGHEKLQARRQAALAEPAQPRTGPQYGGIAGDGTSIFDPVLTELMYRWFCPPSGLILDPFAGGSVRGIVAGLLGYRYRGIDLNAGQLAANAEQLLAIAPGASVSWMHGDSAEVLAEPPLPGEPLYDFVFSCPPYGDLEVYSEDPRDLSTMDYPAFIEQYRAIIASAVAHLAPNRMACFVVGDFRDKRTGYYRGFVADTINAFRDAGMGLYNDAILVTSVGTLAYRVTGYFKDNRKLGKMHQNVLVFAKGEPRRAWE